MDQRGFHFRKPKPSSKTFDVDAIPLLSNICWNRIVSALRPASLYTTCWLEPIGSEITRFGMDLGTTHVQTVLSRKHRCPKKLLGHQPHSPVTPRSSMTFLSSSVTSERCFPLSPGSRPQSLGAQKASWFRPERTATNRS